MTKIEDIESRRAVVARGAGQMPGLFEEFDARAFEEKIQRDAKAGKLDKLTAEARANHEAGRREEF